MRTRKVNPRLMCKQHLGGEYNEILKHLHVFEKGQSVAGRIAGPHPQIEPISLPLRFAELKAELQRRADERGRGGPKKDFPYTQGEWVVLLANNYGVDSDVLKARIFEPWDILDLAVRCDDCMKRLMDAGVVGYECGRTHQDTRTTRFFYNFTVKIDGT